MLHLNDVLLLISHDTQTNHTQTTHRQFAFKRLGNILHHMELYVCANMWWIDFYSFETIKPFFSFSVLFCLNKYYFFIGFLFLHCLVSMPNRNNSTKNHESEENEIPLWMRLQWILVLDLDAKVFFSFRMMLRLKCRLWCQHRFN